MITDPDGAEVPDRMIGEIWLRGNNIGRGYFGRDDETQRVFANKLQSRLEQASHAEGAPDNGYWLATGASASTSRRTVSHRGDQRPHHHRRPQPLSPRHRNHGQPRLTRHPHRIRRRVPGSSRRVRIIGRQHRRATRYRGRTRRGCGPGRSRPDPRCVRAAVARQHHIGVADIKLVAAGAIPRTTSGKLARNACRTDYLTGRFDRSQ